jgi:NADH-quinone oxidoreductase subunit A
VNWQLIEDASPLILALGLALSIPVLFMVLSSWLGPRHPNQAKNASYESGLPEVSQVGDARSRFGVRFFLVAICFLVFDVEVAFLFPWAVWFRDHAPSSLWIMGSFLGVLAFGWFYVIKRGVLKWD